MSATFWKLCREVDARNARLRRLQKAKSKDTPHFAASTIELAKWLRKFHPDRLPRLYSKHPGLKDAFEKNQI